MIREADKSLFPLHPDHVIHAKPESKELKSDVSSTDATELKRRILNFLASRNRPALRQLDVKVDGGVVLLSGRVRSFYDKQLASHCCSRVAGVLRVIDGICVIPEPSEIAVG